MQQLKATKGLSVQDIANRSQASATTLYNYRSGLCSELPLATRLCILDLADVSTTIEERFSLLPRDISKTMLRLRTTRGFVSALLVERPAIQVSADPFGYWIAMIDTLMESRGMQKDVDLAAHLRIPAPRISALRTRSSMLSRTVRLVLVDELHIPITESLLCDLMPSREIASVSRVGLLHQFFDLLFGSQPLNAGALC